MENCAIQNAHNDMRRENMEYHLTQNVTCLHKIRLLIFLFFGLFIDYYNDWLYDVGMPSSRSGGVGMLYTEEEKFYYHSKIYDEKK